MRISFEVDHDEAVIALMYELGLGERIKSKRRFKRVLNSYFRQNGLQCQDDHECENEQYRSEAVALIKKYGYK